VTACGDGSLKLFDLGLNDFPVMNFHEHKRETFSVCWNPVNKDTFISSSWDGTVKIVGGPIGVTPVKELLTQDTVSGPRREATLSRPSR
jgi:WD40 repeat protein